MSANDWIIKGIEHSQNKDYEKAIKCYEKALEIDPEDVEASIRQKVTRYHMTGNLEELEKLD